ncbi:UNKNOWN [Stylonychia lemnae]|uniref:Uncharacterized protein n=1 Tax=Stylonychia lemnae TaxID=5949 RepID=A0A077ZRS9_STYLE|nr:UNKNOWN [Stylonychia lemnae]|eukprot:CDW72623.1 UNKNOWN [Stylonychia lemnae]
MLVCLIGAISTFELTKTLESAKKFFDISIRSDSKNQLQDSNKNNSTSNSNSNNANANSNKSSTNSSGNSNKTNTNSSGNSNSTNITNNTVPTIPTPTNDNYTTVRYLAWAIRSTQTGIYRGLYKSSNYTANEKCMDRVSVDNMYYMMRSYFNSSLINYGIFQSIRDLTYLFIQNCEFDDILYDIAVFCNTHDCSFEKIGSNMMGTFMQISAAATEQANLLQGPLPNMKSQIEVHNFYSNFALNFGKELRYALDFQYKP